MVSVIDHRTALQTVLKKWVDYVSGSPSSGQHDASLVPIVDEPGGHYLLMNVGWNGKKRSCNVLFYARIHDGKIWVEDDWTEEGIANELVEAGVPRDQIVLGFQPPSMRPLTEFASA